MGSDGTGLCQQIFEKRVPRGLGETQGQVSFNLVWTLSCLFVGLKVSRMHIGEGQLESQLLQHYLYQQRGRQLLLDVGNLDRFEVSCVNEDGVEILDPVCVEAVQ